MLLKKTKLSGWTEWKEVLEGHLFALKTGAFKTYNYKFLRLDNVAVLSKAANNNNNMLNRLKV